MVFACGLSRALLWKSSNHLSLPNRKYAAGPPNTGLQRTALGADKIRAILKPGFGLTAFPIYDCAAAEAQAVGRHSRLSFPANSVEQCYTIPRQNNDSGRAVVTQRRGA